MLSLKTQTWHKEGSESATAQELLENDSTDRVPEASEEAPRKSARIDPDAPESEPSTKQKKISFIT